ncbi:MAG: tetratricopeptide repeat protein, partial [Muribaculaceae bacterium]|nr:tetratricopeptide repeat protein [Muribaculaceae bacterium]
LDILGENHPAVAGIYFNIGCTYYRQGDYVRALEYFEKTLGIRLRYFDENHPDVKRVKENIEDVKGKMAGEKQ